MTVKRLAAVLAATALSAACSSSTEPLLPAIPTTPGYSVSVSGDLRASVQGTPRSLINTRGYSETDAAGATRSTSVVLVSFVTSDPSQPSLTVGLMGPLAPGTYNLRSFGTSAPGSLPEFYASVSQSETDGLHNFDATSGTITIVEAGQSIRGRLSIHSARVIVVPPNTPDGTSFTSKPASVDIVGVFDVTAPTTTIP